MGNARGIVEQGCWDRARRLTTLSVHLGRSMAVFMLLLPAGCNQTDPAAPYNRDLGDKDTVLLPTTSVFTIPDIAQGQADWIPFREPSSTQPTAVAEEKPVNNAPEKAAPSAGASPSDNEGIEKEIHDLVSEYNDVVENGSVDELLDYYVENQVDTLKPLFQSVQTVRDLSVQLRKELEAKMPDAGDRIAKAFDVIQAGFDFQLQVRAIDVQSDTEAKVTTADAAFGTTYHFVLVDDEWFIQVPGLENMAKLKPSLDLVIKIHRQWFDGLRNGQVSAEDTLKKVEVMAKAAQTGAQP